eukprot:RCo048513
MPKKKQVHPATLARRQILNERNPPNFVNGMPLHIDGRVIKPVHVKGFFATIPRNCTAEVSALFACLASAKGQSAKCRPAWQKAVQCQALNSGSRFDRNQTELLKSFYRYCYKFCQDSLIFDPEGL